MKHQTVTDMSGEARCDDCDWTYRSPMGSDAILMASAHANAPEGHSVDGCQPVFTDCCEPPRWECQTYTPEGGLPLCVAGRGCRA